MVYIIPMLTVKQLSSMAGVTPRTLHDYDQIDLLTPSRIGDNGYRYYREDAVLKLQQILFYRELGIPLDEIKKILGRRDFEILTALENHKKELSKKKDKAGTFDCHCGQYHYASGRTKEDERQTAI